jgi:tRNA-specific 2-thiouridylase
VLAVNPTSNTVVVGDEEDLFSRELLADDAHWIPGAAPADTFRAAAKVRSTAPASACRVDVDGPTVRVRFDRPERALAPGQAVVFYEGDLVMGGATIAAGGCP